jgi:hypothetical protein
MKLPIKINYDLKFLPYAFAAILLCSSQACRTVNPTASQRLKDNQSKPQTAADEPRTTTELFQWVVVKPGNPTPGSSNLTTPQNVFAWDVELKTAPEVWCERRCSEFRIEEVDDGPTRSLKALKTSILGNTTPGMLYFQRQITGSREQTAKVKLENVGVMGQSVILEDMINRDHPNFYAVPMTITKHPSGVKAILRGEFDGRVVEIRQVPEAVDVAVKKSPSPQQAFVMGSLITEKGPDGKENAIFMASSILWPWSAD